MYGHVYRHGYRHLYRDVHKCGPGLRRVAPHLVHTAAPALAVLPSVVVAHGLQLLGPFFVDIATLFEVSLAGDIGLLAGRLLPLYEVHAEAFGFGRALVLPGDHGAYLQAAMMLCFVTPPGMRTL